MKASLCTTWRIAVAVFILALAPHIDAHSAKPETTFTIAVIPDTQNYLDYHHQVGEGYPFEASELFLAQLRYVADHLKSQGGDIVFVSALGDVWEHQTLDIDPDHAARGFKRVPNPLTEAFGLIPSPKTQSVEMPMAQKGYELLRGKVPFSVVPGNHDYDAMWTDANHPPAAEFKNLSSVGVMHAGGLRNFKTVFSDQSAFFKGQPWYVASHDDGADSAQIFSAGGYRFLHIGLQFDAPNASLEWAASVVRRFPGLPTIVSTHDYLNNDGERLPNPVIDNAVVDPEDNSPQMMWEKFISQHDQIFLVLCGHHHGQAMRNDPNRFGHSVYQVLSDYQDRGQTAKDAGDNSKHAHIGDGWMRMMHFDMGAKTPTVHVRTYSTHYKKFSLDTTTYAEWYKEHEKPKLSDADFHATEDFVIALSGFHARFHTKSRAAK